MCSLWLIICLSCGLTGFSASAQIQQAWVARYNNGITNGTNQAVKMILDPQGNIYVAGFSQNTNSQLGCAIIKYAPNGNQLWVSRIDSAYFPTATPAALALDSSNNVFVTGTCLTEKFDQNGNLLWVASYTGTALAVDAGGNAYVTETAGTFSTVKLSPGGSNVWSAAYPSSYGPGVAQQVLVGTDGSIYVPGYSTTWSNRLGRFVALLLIKYDPNGNQLWAIEGNTSPYAPISSQVEGAILDGAGNCYILLDYDPEGPHYMLYKYSPTGNLEWTALDPNQNPPNDVPHGLALDKLGNVFATGQSRYVAPSDAYVTFESGFFHLREEVVAADSFFNN
jgi:hypothetical protein